jgi:hypothetical protein
LHGSGNFENNSVFGSIDCTLTAFLDRGFGNFVNVGELFSSDVSNPPTPQLTLLHVAGDLSNTGNWYAEISNYCVEGDIDDMQMGTASINDNLPGFEFCALAMGADCSCPEFNPPAPVEFLYFRGSEQNKKSHLEWATSQEINNKGFEIQRSMNGQTFETIGFVEGNGTVSSKMEYQFVDMTPFVGENIYRLKQVDYNGSFKHSNLVSIPIESRMSIEAIPNPARSFELSMLYFNDDASTIELIIYDIKGAVIYQNSYPARSGGNEIDLSDLFLIEGIYFVQARAGIHTSSAKFMIIK